MNKTVSTTEKWIQKERRVWVAAKPHLPNLAADAFLQAKVINLHAKEVIVVLKQEDNQVSYGIKQYSVAYEDCQKLTYGPTDVSDMVDLQELNEPELLYNLNRRYLNDLIFTYCGPTLVIINPYATIQKLFNSQLLFDYQTNVFLDNLQYKTLPPHVFSLAAFCLWQLFDNQRNQSIVISGQSGAGKTQNTKFCLKFLASLGKNMKALPGQKAQKILSTKAIRNINKNNKLKGIEDKILGCNEILQAFGNAKTIRNDNSSRFGKLILLIYGQTQIDIKSAFIVSYLLEKSRVVSIAQGERNYHILYYFLKGTSPEQKKQYYLTKPIHQYKYVNQSSVFSIAGTQDQKKYAQVHNEFKNYFSEEQTTCIFTIIASILNLGNLTFKKELSKNNQQMAIVVNKQYLINVALLLGLNNEEFQYCFSFKTRKIGGSVISSPLRYDEAVALQNSFAKNLYQRTFFYLVTKLNQKIQLEKVNLQQNNKSFRKSIGLLDIFGFQVLEINSLQQFFINFANEKLQQLYVSYIFKQQQNEFLREGLKEFAHDIGFQDNKPVIDLFQLYPLGIFHLINQSSELNSPDQNLPESIFRNHPKNQFITIPKSKRGVFMISHSCSPVNYHTAGFSGRNKDQFPQQLLDVIFKGKHQILKVIITGSNKNNQTKNRTASKKFLGSKFLNDISKLTQELYSSDCHFVRCIKPNSKKAPRTFNSQAVLQSLRYLGVLDSILIRKLGYIYRRPFKQFIKKFFQIQQPLYRWDDFVKWKGEDDFKQYSRNFIVKYAPNNIGDREILIGHKKILIKQSALNHLEAMTKQKRKMRHQCANKLQTMWKKHKNREKVFNSLKRFALFKGYLVKLIEHIRTKILNKKCSKIQKKIKKYLLDKRLQKIKEAATKSVSKIAAYYRMVKQRAIYLKIRHNTIKIQANIRFFLTMAAYFRVKNCRQTTQYIFEQAWRSIENKKAVLIQKTWKGYKVRRKFKKIMEEIRRKLRLAKYRDYLMQAIFQYKYQKYQAILNRYKAPIIRLQAIVRGKFARKTFQTMRCAAVLIQNAFRRHLHKKYYLIRLWRNYRKNLYKQQKLKVRELGKFGLVNSEVKDVKFYPQTVGKLMQHFPRQLLSRYGKGEQGVADWSINQTIFYNDKNTLQIYIADYDIIGCQYYSGRWLSKYSEVKEEMKRKSQYPISLSLGEEFTSVLSNKQRLYTFFNDDRESRRLDFQGQSSLLCVGDRAGYSLRSDGTIYAWGYNYQNFIQEKQQILIDGKQDTKLTKLKVAGLWCKGKQRHIVDRQGKAVQLVQQHLTSSWKIIPIDFGFKNTIKSVALSYNFVIFLNSQGHLYGCGDNSKGQLGLNYTSTMQSKLQPINYLSSTAKEIIQTVAVGMGHVVAKSKLGYVYTWGDNCYQQVTNKKVKFLTAPEALEGQEGRIKVLQAVAAMRTTFLLTDNMKTVGFGTSSTFNSQKGIYNVPLQLLKQTASSKNLVQIKLSVKWIRQISILFVHAFDMSRCKPGTKPDVMLKYAKMMAKQWLDDRIYPQYHEWTDNILQLSDLRKFKFANSSPTAAKVKVAKQQTDLEELKALLELRKTSLVFKRAAAQKVEQILVRLRTKAEAEWSESDRQLNKIITESMKVLN